MEGPLSDGGGTEDNDNEKQEGSGDQAKEIEKKPGGPPKRRSLSLQEQLKVAIEAENKEESLKLANLIAHQNDSLRQKLIRANHDVSHLRVQLDRLLRERKQHEFYLQLAARDRQQMVNELNRSRGVNPQSRMPRPLPHMSHPQQGRPAGAPAPKPHPQNPVMGPPPSHGHGVVPPHQPPHHPPRGGHGPYPRGGGPPRGGRGFPPGRGGPAPGRGGPPPGVRGAPQPGRR